MPMRAKALLREIKLNVEKQHEQTSFGVSCNLLKKNYGHKEKKSLS